MYGLRRPIGAMATMGAVLVLLAGHGCAGSGVTKFIHDEYNFGFIERVAIVPLTNISGDRGAGARATYVLLSELFAARAFDIVEPGEVAHVLGRFPTAGSEYTTEQLIAIGKELNAQGLFLGAVTESVTQRSGTASVVKVTVALRLVETEKGETVWNGSGTSGGRGFFASLFGGGGKSENEVTRDCVRKVLNTLLD